MKKILSLVLSGLFCLTAVGCNVGGTGESESSLSAPNSVEEVTIPTGYTRYDVGEWNNRTLLGFGGQLDTHIYKGDFANFDGFSEDELTELYKRCKEMNLQNIRTQIFPEWYERANDNGDYNSFDYNGTGVDFNSIEMQQLYRLLDFCEENNVSVDLSFYGCCAIYASQDGKINGSWLGAKFTNSWTTAPKTVDENGNPFPGYEEYAESVYGCLNYILNVKNYTCVNEFSIYPEPNLSFVQGDGTNSFTGFIKLCKMVDAKLKAEGIRDQIEFSGPADASTTVANYYKYLSELDGVLDRATVSTYRFEETTSNSIFYDYASAMVEGCDEFDVPWGLAEFGTVNTYEGDEEYYIHMDSYNRAMFMARYMINLFNAGCTNMKVWTLNDVNYGGYVMAMGLWKFRDENWEARPAYYSWSLITKYTDKGAKIYPITSKDENVCMIAFELPDGSWSYMMANDSTDAKKVSIVNAAKNTPDEMSLYLVSESNIPVTREVKPLTSLLTLEKEDGAYNVEIPANSFIVISDKAA